MFPQQERALATGLFKAGAALGMIASPLAVWPAVWLAVSFGWQWAFIAIGTVGLFRLYFLQRHLDERARHLRVSAAELAPIRGSQAPTGKVVKLPWTTLLRYREIWPFLIGKVLIDPVWWFFLFWLPSCLEREREQNPLKSAGLVAVIDLGSSVGSVFGGWLSGHLTQRGWPVGRDRMMAIGLAVACMPGTLLADYTNSFAVCAGLMHLTSLTLLWFWFRGRFERVDVDTGLDVSRPHRALLAAGSAVALLGMALSWLIGVNWEVCIAAAKFSGAAQTLTADVGLGLISGLLVFVSMPKPRALPISPARFHQ